MVSGEDPPDTLSDLECLTEARGAKSLDDTVWVLVSGHRRGFLAEAFGVDMGKVKPFTEEDRAEDR